MQAHAGVFGAHRSAEKTLGLLRRVVYWEGMKEQVEAWVGQCLNCLKGRKRPAKQLAVPVRPSGLECWQEVMCDLEGPNPPDKDGNKYVLTYLDVLSHSLYY